MKIYPIITQNSLQNIFYMIEYGDKKALMIDPCDSELAKIFLEKNNLTLEKILITHEHFDHYQGVEGLECENIYAGEITAQSLPFGVTHICLDGERICEFDTMSLRAIATPGHAAGHMIFELSERVTIGDTQHSIPFAVFSGDVLFAGGVGNTRTGSSEDLYESVQKFRDYDDEVILYPGHDYLQANSAFIQKNAPENTQALQEILKKSQTEVYFTNMGEERSYNPFFTASREEFIELRHLRNNF